MTASMAQGISASISRLYCRLIMAQLAIVGIADLIASCSAGDHWNVAPPATGCD